MFVHDYLEEHSMAKALTRRRKPGKPVKKKVAKKKVVKKRRKGAVGRPRKRASVSTRKKEVKGLYAAEGGRAAGTNMSEKEILVAKIRASTLRAEGRAWNDICRIVGVWYSTLQYWRNDDLEFDVALHVADKLRLDALENEIYHRGLDGVVEDIFDKLGNKIGERHRKSDTCLLAALKYMSPKWKRALSTTIHATDEDSPLKFVMSLFDSTAGELPEQAESAASESPRGLLSPGGETLYDGYDGAEGSDED